MRELELRPVAGWDGFRCCEYCKVPSSEISKRELCVNDTMQKHWREHH